MTNGLWEFPVTVWQDQFGLRRHAQLCSCSFYEMKRALLTAWRCGWHSFVIVSHSFELLKKRRQNVDNPKPDKVVVRRFQQLCQSLSENRDKFETCGFNDLDPATIPIVAEAEPLPSSVFSTGRRMLEQAYMSRIDTDVLQVKVPQNGASHR